MVQLMDQSGQPVMEEVKSNQINDSQEDNSFTEMLRDIDGKTDSE